jgi:ribonucleoside-diphosphate reductase alpha chain
MSATIRTRLPNRRPTIIEEVDVGGLPMTVTVGLDPETLAPREVFLAGGKAGSAFDAIASDAAVVLSIALQHGVAAEALAHSIARIPLGPTRPEDLDGRPVPTMPASPVGAALDVLAHTSALLARAKEAVSA